MSIPSSPATLSAPGRRRVPRFAAALLAGLAAFSGIAQAKAEPVLPKLTTPAARTVVEGDTGSTTVELSFSLDRVPTANVTFAVRLEWQEWNTTPGVDASEFAPRTLTIAPGQTTAKVSFDVYGDLITEQDQQVTLQVDNLVGATFADGSGYGTVVTIDDDDVNDVSDWVVNDDELLVYANTGSEQFALDENDARHTDWSRSATFTTEILDAPAHGVVQVLYGTTVRYTAEPGFLGTDTFGYRICIGGSPCQDGIVTVHVLPFNTPYGTSGAGHSGFVEVMAKHVEGHPLSTSRLAAPEPVNVELPVDRSPADRSDDGGVAYGHGVVPAAPAGTTREHVLMFETEFGIHLLDVGIDTDGNGALSDAELTCRSARLRCLVNVVAGDAATPWLVRLHNDYEAPVTVTVSVYDMVMGAPDGTLTATGPGRESGWWREMIRVGWNDPSMLDQERRVGILRLANADGTTLVDTPIQFSRFGGESQPVPLVSGRAQALALSGWTRQRHLFIDVPAGATRLSVAVGGGHADGTAFHVARRSAALDAASVAVDAAPEIADAVATGNTNVAGGAVVIEGAALVPGRWYIVPANGTEDEIALSVTATVEAVAPVVRPGSYFNAGRSGSGVFLYPAADQWTGLWYTYFDDSRPTWYYLQAAAPGADGLWHSPILRATWNGATRSLTAVGEATLTPTAPDAFTLTYTIDGVVGTQPMQALGRGCPASDSGPVDISSTWFDPTKTGTGYSVQLWGDYEYHAAFVYDEQGVPMFLAAELDHFGGDEAVLTLQRLLGACPTCEFAASTRTDIGTFVRRLAGGTLDGVEIDAVYQDGNPGWQPPMSTWSAEDHVQMLGGPGTTQGCEP